MSAVRAVLDPCLRPGSLADGWALLHEAGAAVAELAQLGAEPMPLTPEAFALRAFEAGASRQILAGRAIDDCAAMLHYGLEALIAVRERGEDCTSASLTLWREFHQARETLLALTAPAAA